MTADDQPHHQPLRLSTVIHAPVERVEAILADHPDVRTLLDNDWLSLTVVDPTQDHCPFHYEADLEWSSLDDQIEVEPENQRTAALADD